MFNIDFVPNFTYTTIVGIVFIFLSLLYGFYIRPVFLSGLKALLKPLVKVLDSLAIGLLLLGIYLVWFVSIIQDFFNTDSQTALWASIIITILIVVLIYKFRGGKAESRPTPFF